MGERARRALWLRAVPRCGRPPSRRRPWRRRGRTGAAHFRRGGAQSQRYEWVPRPLPRTARQARRRPPPWRLPAACSRASSAIRLKCASSMSVTSRLLSEPAQRGRKSRSEIPANKISPVASTWIQSVNLPHKIFLGYEPSLVPSACVKYSTMGSIVLVFMVQGFQINCCHLSLMVFVGSVLTAVQVQAVWESGGGLFRTLGVLCFFQIAVFLNEAC